MVHGAMARFFPLVVGLVMVAMLVYGWSSTREPLLLVFAGAVLVFVGYMSFVGPGAEAAAFLKGLRDAGEVVDLVADEKGRQGRRIVVRGVQGTWSIEAQPVATGGRRGAVGAELWVRGPKDAAPVRVIGSPRKVARKAAERGAVGWE